MTNAEESNYNYSDSSEDEEQYSKLVSSVTQLDSTQRVKPALRKEISSEVSEYSLTKVSDKINVKELAQVLKKKPKHESIAKMLKKVTEKSKTLPKPLEKPLEEKIKRKIGFENVKNQLMKWDAVVTRNALKDSLTFPLSDNSLNVQNTSNFLSKYKNSTPLEKEIEVILKQEKKPEKEEEINKYPLTLEELLEKRKEMANIRAKLSYKMAKAHRQNKIKSRKYHRILKREKLKQQLKDFEVLQKTDPEAALKKLEELDKNRALERASLRHRNTGQWAKNMAVRAKYDTESRKILSEQLKMSREITQKVHNLESSDEEDTQTIVPDFEKESSKSLFDAKDNPWSLDVNNEVQTFVSEYKKYWSEMNQSANNEVTTDTTANKHNILEETNKSLTVNDKRTEKNSVASAKLDVKYKETEINDSMKLKKECLEKSNKTKFQDFSKQKKMEKKNNKAVKSEEVEKLCKTSLGSENKKLQEKKKRGSVISVRPTSGVWIITSVIDEQEGSPKIPKKRKGENINNLFEDLEETLFKQAEKKVKKLNAKIKKVEKKTKLKKKKESKEKEQAIDLSFKNVNVAERPNEDIGLLEGDVDINNFDLLHSAVPTDIKVNDTSEIDPKKFIKVKPKRLNTLVPDNTTCGEDGIDDEEERQQIIEEAFGDDDVIAEFRESKEEEAKEDLEIQTELPGWGEWGGTGIAPSKRKKKQLTVSLPPRKDEKKDDMIINENENPKIKDHLVKMIPFPFKTSEAFAANIRSPVGRDWIPETAHRKLIQKPIQTKLGSIIEPMSENEIINTKRKPKSPYQGKKKTRSS